MQQNDKIIGKINQTLKEGEDKTRIVSIGKTTIITNAKKAAILTVTNICCNTFNPFDFIFDKLRTNAKIKGTTNSFVEDENIL
ncbi:MAG: hypothetical protein FWH41_10505 [Treponema sp.]|nr:hypothetical protein [Treponema sp.]